VEVGGERFVDAVARASGGEAHDLIFKTFAALPQSGPTPTINKPSVKPMKVQTVHGPILLYRRRSIKTWANATFSWTEAKI
jgi:hypothetical protein